MAAIVVGAIAAGLQPASASSYEPPLSVPNVTTVNIDHGPLDNPPAEGYWDIDWPQPDEQSTLSAFVVNNGDQPVSYVLVFQISYINNVTQTVMWQATELNAGESKVVSVPWTPDHPGYFRINIFAASELEKPAPLSDAALLQTFVGPQEPLLVENILPDLIMLTTDQNSRQVNQTGILGTFSFLMVADSGIPIQKNAAEISSGDTVKFGFSDSEPWVLKETSIQYYRIGEDFTIRKSGDYYVPAQSPTSFNFLSSDGETEYAVDLPKGDYVFRVYTTFQYKMEDMLLDEGDGHYFFRVAVD